MTECAIVPLRNRPNRDVSNNSSDTIYVRGLARSLTDEDVDNLLSIVDAPQETDFSQRSKSGTIWAKYENLVIAKNTVQRLHQTNACGVYLSVKYEFGIDGAGKRIPGTVFFYIIYIKWLIKFI
jgi:hypothetical protein